MSNQFTKSEAAELLGEVFQVNKNYPCNDDRYQSGEIVAGEVGKITGIDFYNNEVKLSLDIYGNYHLVTKSDFKRHFVILKPIK